MNNIAKSNIKYLSNLLTEQLGEALCSVIKTDLYIRQPCYSSNWQDQFLIILTDNTDDVINKIRYISSEFPEFILNYLTINELKVYPRYSLWMLYYSQVIYQKKEFDINSYTQKPDHLEGICQAIASVGHIARMYYLRDLNYKNHTWAVRQIGWALRYTELGIISLWNLLSTGQYTSSVSINEIKEDVDYICNINENWKKVEIELLSDINLYNNVSLKLSKITEWYAKELVNLYHLKKYKESNDQPQISSNITELNNFISEINSLLAKEVVALYLSGSAARNDTHKTSDIDTIIIFNTLDEKNMGVLKNILSKFPKISAYTLSADGLSTYPDFRYYTLNSGTKKVYGSISFNENIDNHSFIIGMINNIFVIKQVARHYFVNGNLGQRSIHLLILMMKLMDHGVLRIYQKIVTNQFPEQKSEVKDFFNNDDYINQFLENLMNINDIKDAIENELQNGNISDVINHFKELDQVSDYFLKKYCKKYI